MSYQLVIHDTYSGRVERRRYHSLVDAQRAAQPYLAALQTAPVYALEIRDGQAIIWSHPPTHENRG